MGELLIIRWRDYSKPAQWKARWFVLLALTGLKSQGVLTSKPTLMENIYKAEDNLGNHLFTLILYTTCTKMSSDFCIFFTNFIYFRKNT